MFIWKSNISSAAESFAKKKHYKAMAETEDGEYLILYNQWSMGSKYCLYGREKLEDGRYIYDFVRYADPSNDSFSALMRYVENAFYRPIYSSRLAV